MKNSNCNYCYEWFPTYTFLPLHTMSELDLILSEVFALIRVFHLFVLCLCSHFICIGLWRSGVVAATSLKLYLLRDEWCWCGCGFDYLVNCTSLVVVVVIFIVIPWVCSFWCRLARNRNRYTWHISSLIVLWSDMGENINVTPYCAAQRKKSSFTQRTHLLWFHQDYRKNCQPFRFIVASLKAVHLHWINALVSNA